MYFNRVRQTNASIAWTQPVKYHWHWQAWPTVSGNASGTGSVSDLYFCLDPCCFRSFICLTKRHDSWKCQIMHEESSFDVASSDVIKSTELAWILSLIDFFIFILFNYLFFKSFYAKNSCLDYFDSRISWFTKVDFLIHEMKSWFTVLCLVHPYFIPWFRDILTLG